MPADPAQGHINLVASRALTKVLAQREGRHVVVSPGARNAPLVVAMAHESRLRMHVVLDERAAGFVALGLAKATQEAVVLVCTSGSAGGHYLPAVMEAFHSHIPLVVITADRPEELLHQGAAQTTQQDGLFQYHVRACRRLPTPRGQPGGQSAMVTAWRLQTEHMLAEAKGAAMGPVHINAPFAEPLLPEPAACAAALAAGDALTAPTAVLAPASSEPTHDGYLALQDFVREHPRGVLVCGPLPSEGGDFARAAAIVRLAQVLGWPVVADPLSGLRYLRHGIDPQQLLYRYDQRLKAGLAPPPADGVLCLGAQPTSKALQGWLQGFAGHVAALGAAQEPQPVHALCALRFAGDVRAACAGLAQRLYQEGACPVAAGHVQAWHAWQEQTTAAQELPNDAQDEGSMSPAQAWPILLRAMPENSGLHVGSSMPVRDLDSFGGVVQHNLRISSSRGLNGIDGFIATLAGLALGDSRPWLGVAGDLTFLHDIGALQSARQLRVSATLVVLNNGGGEIFAKLPIALHTQVFERYFRTPQAADLGLLCAACACSHEVVYTPAALGQAVTRAMRRPADGRLHVIEASMLQGNPFNHA